MSDAPSSADPHDPTAVPPEPVGALAGITVLDLSRLLPGPYCTMILGDLGADVIKVEERGFGDAARYENLMPAPGAPERTSFEILNRNKRSITLDLKHPDGRAVALALARRADVLVEGFRPGVMERLGLGWDTLHAENRALVYCAITGYGRGGPRRDRPGHDLNYVGQAGILDMTGDPEGTPPPLGTQLADLAGGALPAVIGILAALRARDRTGSGQLVDVGMMQGAFALNLIQWAEAQDRPAETVTRGATHLTGRYPCYDVYRTADGRAVTLGALEPKFWKGFCTRVERPEWIPLHMAKDAATRARLRAEVAELFGSRPAREWLALLEDEGLCVGPVARVTEVADDPQILAAGAIFDAPTRSGRTVRHTAAGFRLSDTPCRFRLPAPAVGEHTREILAELGYDLAAIEALISTAAV